MAGTKFIYMRDEAMEKLAEIMEKNPQFNFSAFVQDALMNYLKMAENVSELDTRMKNIDLEIEKLRNEKHLCEEKIFRLKEKEKAELEDESLKIEKRKKDRKFHIEIITGQLTHLFDVSTEKAKELATEYVDLPKSEENNPYKFGRSRGLKDREILK